ETGGPASVDGGEGDDTVRLTATSAATVATLGTAANAETLIVEEGTWKLTDGAVNFSDITLEDGATVTSTIRVGDGGHLVIEAGATVSGTNNANLVQWTGGTTTVDNYGNITANQQNDNGVRGTVTAGDFTFNNHEGAEIDALFLVTGGAGSSLHLTNAGTMAQ